MLQVYKYILSDINSNINNKYITSGKSISTSAISLPRSPLKYYQEKREDENCRTIYIYKICT